MNKRERERIRKLLREIKILSPYRKINIKADLIGAIVDVDEHTHSYKADNINRTRSLGNLNEFGSIKK